MSTSILDQLVEVSVLLERDMARAFAGTPLTPTRAGVLWTIDQAGPSTQQALAGALQVSARNVTGLIDALEVGGYVIRTPHPTDRRAVLIELTPLAEALVAQMRRDHDELTASLLNAVAPADRAAATRALTAIAARLSQLVAAASVPAKKEIP